MNKLIAATAILGLLFVGILGGIFLNQTTVSGLLCLFAWSPACIFLGVAMAGLRLSVSVQPKEQAILPNPTESAKQIRQRVSKVEQ